MKVQKDIQISRTELMKVTVGMDLALKDKFTVIFNDPEIVFSQLAS